MAMAMANLTLSLDDALLQKAREAALPENTSVNALVRTTSAATSMPAPGGSRPSMPLMELLIAAPALASPHGAGNRFTSATWFDDAPAC